MLSKSSTLGTSFSCIWVALTLLCIIHSCCAETIEDYICTQRFKGCRVNYKERSCIEEEFVGCKNPFPYKNMRECLKDFHGKGNVCEHRKPCRHNGTCSPITTVNNVRTFKCECAATGYYGDRCEIKCPKDLSAKDPKMLPCLWI